MFQIQTKSSSRIDFFKQKYIRNIENIQYEKKLKYSLDNILFTWIESKNEIYLHHTNILCSIQQNHSFLEKNLYEVQAQNIPIYRLFEYNEDENKIYGTNYYGLAFEENMKITQWKCFYKPDFSEKIEQYKLHSYLFYQLFELLGSNQIDLHISYINPYKGFQLHYENENRSESSFIYTSQNTPNIETNSIDSFYEEYMIESLQPYITQQIYIHNNDIHYSSSLFMEDIQLVQNLLGNRYSFDIPTKYMLKINEFSFHTFISI
jgi:hypothetical protein